MCPACLASIAIATALSTTGVTASVAAALGIRKVIKNKNKDKNLALEKNHEYDDHSSDNSIGEGNESDEEDNGSRSEGAPSAG